MKPIRLEGHDNHCSGQSASQHKLVSGVRILAQEYCLRPKSRGRKKSDELGSANADDLLVCIDPASTALNTGIATLGGIRGWKNQSDTGTNSR